MQVRFWPLLAVLALSAAVAGCGAGSTGTPSSGAAKDKEDAHPAGKADDPETIRANLAKLGPGDRKLAEEQQFCAVEIENPLGSMGKPYKVMVKDQPVFLCCDGCETKAKAHADRTLARVEQLKEKNKGETPPK